MAKKKKGIPEGIITSEKLTKKIGMCIGLKNINQDTFLFDFQELRIKQNRNDLSKQKWFYNEYINLFNKTYAFIGRKYYLDKSLTQDERIKKTIDSFYGSIRKLYQFGTLSNNQEIVDFTKYIKLAYFNKFGGTFDRELYHEYLTTIKLKLEKPYSIKISEIYQFQYPEYIFGFERFLGMNVWNINNYFDILKKIRHDFLIFLDTKPFLAFSAFSVMITLKYEIFNTKNNFYELQEFTTLTRLNDTKKRLKQALRKAFNAIKTHFFWLSSSVIYHIYESTIFINYYK